MHRFFVPADWVTSSAVAVGSPVAQQIRRVLRLRAGEHVMLLDNSGWEMEAELTVVDDAKVEATIRRRSLGAGEPRTKITLFQALLKGDHFSDVLKQCTQIGVVEFVPIVSERCIVGDVDQASERVRRWQRVVVEAAEQSHRCKLPALRPVTLLANALESVAMHGLALIPWEEERLTSLSALLRQKTLPPAVPPAMPTASEPAAAARRRKPTLAASPRRPFSVNIFIGPEGGFTSNEIAIARHYGVVPVTLGPRVLRAETAGLVAATVALHELGDMG